MKDSSLLSYGKRLITHLPDGNNSKSHPSHAITLVLQGWEFLLSPHLIPSSGFTTDSETSALIADGKGMWLEWLLLAHLHANRAKFTYWMCGLSCVSTKKIVSQSSTKVGVHTHLHLHAPTQWSRCHFFFKKGVFNFQLIKMGTETKLNTIL